MVEKTLVAEALDAADGNIFKASEALGCQSPNALRPHEET